MADPNDLADLFDDWADFAAEGYGPIDWDGFDHRKLRAAAARLRQLHHEVDAYHRTKLALLAERDEYRRQLDTLRNAIGELTLDHQPMWASPMGGFTSTAVEGREAVGCVVCFPADGSWPCTTRLIAVDTLAAAGGGVPEEGA